MIRIIIFTCLALTIIDGLSAQGPGCNFKIEKTDVGKYKVQVAKFDSLESGETCFLSWMNTGEGKPDGELLVYDEMGRKRRLAVYKGGIRVGTHYEWYATGELYSMTNWETDTYFNSKNFYRSGKIRSTAVNGNRSNAVYTSYYENGQTESVTDGTLNHDKKFYPDGKRRSQRDPDSYIEWYDNGKTKVTGALEDSYTRVGKWSYYDANGKLVRELVYGKNSPASYHDEKGYIKEIKY